MCFPNEKQNEQAAGAALALSLGIAIQNFPEGAIISMPLAAEGRSKKKAFIYGVLSLYVVVEELIPEMSEGEHSNIGVVMFAMGFSLMMALDVALG